MTLRRVGQIVCFAIPRGRRAERFCPRGSVNTGSCVLAAVAEIVGFGFVFGFGYGAIPTFFTENFPTRYRASGASAAYQIAQVYGGGLILIVAGQILRVYGVKGAYPYIGGVVMIYGVLAIIAILRTPETKGMSINAPPVVRNRRP